MNAPSIVIVGAGMSGICAAILLREAGFDEITILERAQELGGTWRDNRYPGVACDVPSRSYTFSFAPNREWTQLYSPGSEIQDYFLRIADTGGIRSRIRFGQEVVEAAWEDGGWEIRTGTGDHFAADVLITATGVLHRWRWPDIPGLLDFGGDLVHTAAWPSDLELSGRRVGLIGVGATGAQVAPELADQSAFLTLFQRTPQWIMPIFNLRYGPLGRTLARRVPAFSRVAHRLYTRGFEGFAWRLALHDGLTRRFTEALCRLHLGSVKDDELRAKLTPDYQPGCKRMVMSGRFYRAVQRPNVDVVTESIAAVDATGVRTADGTHHDLDVLVCATGFGFHAYLRPMRVVAPDRTTLEDAWADGPRAYNTVAMPGFPNFFMLVGPHSPVGSAPVIGTTEAQVEYVVECVRMLGDGRAEYLAPTR
ncbi:MAG: flavin-containing monooxygenase, partial [Solirubrobacteraceae bacterium]